MSNNEWIIYLDMADEMLLDEDYEFASDTIQGIRDWIADNEYVTDAQKEALNSIFRSVEE
jgi:hypothetical protein